jgi:hypothetical protein
MKTLHKLFIKTITFFAFALSVFVFLSSIYLLINLF